MNTTQKKKIIIIGIIVLITLIPLLLFIILKLRTPSQQISQIPIAACPVDAGKCSWAAVSGATSYDYKVTDTSNNTQLKAGNTTATFITFQPEVGKSYRCDVTAKNSCGSGQTGTGTGSCSAPPAPTPTSTPVPSPSPTRAPTPTPTAAPKTCNQACRVNADCISSLICYQGLCRLSANPVSPVCAIPTPTPEPSATPTPTPLPTSTPFPTNTPAPQPVVNTPTPVVATNTPAPVNQIIPTNTPRPTIAQTGSVGVTLGIVGGIIIAIIGGTLLLFL